MMLAQTEGDPWSLACVTGGDNVLLVSRLTGEPIRTTEVDRTTATGICIGSVWHHRSNGLDRTGSVLRIERAVRVRQTCARDDVPLYQRPPAVARRYWCPCCRRSMDEVEMVGDRRQCAACNGEGVRSVYAGGTVAPCLTCGGTGLVRRADA